MFGHHLASVLRGQLARGAMRNSHAMLSVTRSNHVFTASFVYVLWRGRLASSHCDGFNARSHTALSFHPFGGENSTKREQGSSECGTKWVATAWLGFRHTCGVFIDVVWFLSHSFQIDFRTAESRGAQLHHRNDNVRSSNVRKRQQERQFGTTPRSSTQKRHSWPLRTSPRSSRPG